MKIIYIVLFLFSFTVYASGTVVKEDTTKINPVLNVPVTDYHQSRFDRFTSSKFFQITYIPVPLIAAGFILKNESDHFRTLRNSYIPSFRYHYDDILQYMPAVAMVGMKIGGVKSRNSWGRMLTADAFSVLFMASVVNGLKYTMKVERPDGSNRRSFPSGHTATAFMTATMLHHEYGLTVSPWISVAGYATATVTAVSRQLNNRHWLSDVLVGAGIGIITTELGYLLTDFLFKDKGITRKYLSFDPIERFRNPSFFGLTLGFSMLPGHLYLGNGVSLSTRPGSRAGVEGAWFLNPYVGFGGRFTFSALPVSLRTNESTPYDPIRMHSGYAGAYFSYPFSPRWQAGSKLLVGYNLSSKSTLIPTLVETKKWVRPGLGTGLSIAYVAKQNFGVRFFFDYSLVSASFVVHKNEEYNVKETFEKRTPLNVMSVGSSVNILF